LILQGLWGLLNYSYFVKKTSFFVSKKHRVRKKKKKISNEKITFGGQPVLCLDNDAAAGEFLTTTTSAYLPTGENIKTRLNKRSRCRFFIALIEI